MCKYRKVMAAHRNLWTKSERMYIVQGRVRVPSAKHAIRRLKERTLCRRAVVASEIRYHSHPSVHIDGRRSIPSIERASKLTRERVGVGRKSGADKGVPRKYFDSGRLLPLRSQSKEEYEYR